MVKKCVLIVCAFFAMRIPHSASAQQIPPSPYIVSFTSDITSVALSDVESGEMTVTLSWHVYYVEENVFWVRLEAYQDDGWNMIATELDPVGSYEVPLKHPGDFGPPRFRLSIYECSYCSGGSMGLGGGDEWILNIPYTAVTYPAPPEIEFFTVDEESLERELLWRRLDFHLSWAITYRTPLTNLEIEQVNPDSLTWRSCWMHSDPWKPSKGTWACEVDLPRDDPATEVRLRLRVFDVITDEIYDEAEIILPVMGEWPTPRPTSIYPTPTLSPG